MLVNMEFLILCLAILTLAATEGLSVNTSIASQCRNGWSFYGDSCYFFGTSEEDTWIEAISHCNAIHGYLADILDEQENNFVKSELHLKHRSGCYYISATDIEVEGQWLWPNSDELVEYTDWGPSEPQNAGAGENCVCLSDGEQFHWADVACHSTRHFICKMRSDPGTQSGIIG